VQRRRSFRASGVALTAAVLTLVVAAAVAAATGPTVSLTLPGTHSRAPGKCGDAHSDPYSAVARGVRLTIVGSVKPAPKRTNWQARFSIKRCVNRTYRQVWTGKVMGHRTGVFRIPYTPRLGGLYVVVADYGKHPNVSSPKLRLRAR
jgi:ABC-type phosphate transport system substrate-binding protein